MRVAKVVVPIAAALAIAATAAAGNRSSGSYSWAQPNTAAETNPFAGMPAWLVVPEPAPPPVDFGYVWAQPGGTPFEVPYGQASFP